MKASGPTPLRLLAGSFMGLISLGTGLLMLPVATPADRPVGLVDALFTATSATCVTGLVVRDTGTDFTLFGQAVILALIQLGGIGVMTFWLLIFSLLGGRLSLASRSIVTQTLGSTGYWDDFWPLLRQVFRFTFTVEVIGALVLFSHWHAEMGMARAAWAAVFHSISAFCNAGFGLWATSLMDYREDALVNLVICALIILGGLGFITIYEMQRFRGERGRVSLHSRLAVNVTISLIVAGTLLFWLLERRNALLGMAPEGQFLASLFQSVTTRTAGFNTVDIGTLTPGTLFIMILLMFIGGSPGSCAGGIKTTTFGVLVLAAWNRMRQRSNVNAFQRTVSRITLQNTLTITMGGLFVVLVGVFLLLLLESPDATVLDRHDVFMGYLFETVSALGTVGLSTGVTSTLLPASRVVVILLMFFGRLGPLTVAAALSRESSVEDWQYPEEDVMVG